MAQTEYPPLYRNTRAEAVRTHEEELWEDSFRENVCCARAIEKAVRQNKNEEYHIPPDCAAPVLEEYGHKRVGYVLAHTVRELDEISSLRHLISGDLRDWAKSVFVPPDSTYGRYYRADTAIVLLNEFAAQVRQAYQSLGLFGQEHCSAGMYDGNVEGKVLVLSADTLSEKYWSQKNQLWLANGGFGCDPKAKGRAIHATCLGDDETVYWNREDFYGVLDGRYLPEWAQEKLELIQTKKQEHEAASEMGGLEMG